MSKLYLTAAEADEAARRAIRWLCTSVQQQDVVETESEGAVMEIKFRAYQPEAKGDLKWWSWQELRESDLNTIFRHPEKYHLMQYTGLKDKDGVEIYEGDVLGGLLGDGVVVWVPDEARFGISLGGEIHEVYFNELAQSELEVIGNIWDNPELLEATP